MTKQNILFYPNKKFLLVISSVKVAVKYSILTLVICVFIRIFFLKLKNLYFILFYFFIILEIKMIQKIGTFDKI